MARLAIASAAGVVVTVLVANRCLADCRLYGAYNVSATDQHADAIRWTLDTTMHQSVASRAGGAEMPEDVSEELLSEGAGHYTESCVQCHGAPGQDPAAWSRGMRPEPPHLTEAATHWSAKEIHWIVVNGIKISGMPAFGEHHDAEEVAALTAFVRALPGLTPEDYAALTGSGSGRGAGTAHEPHC